MRQKIEDFLNGIKSKLSRRKNDEDQSDFDEYYHVEENDGGEEGDAVSEQGSIDEDATGDDVYDLSEDKKFNFADFKENLRHKFSLLAHKIRSRKTKEMKVTDIDSQTDEAGEVEVQEDLIKSLFNKLNKRLKIQRIPEYLFANKYRSKVHRGFLYCLAGLVAFSVAKNVALFIKGADQTKLNPVAKESIKITAVSAQSYAKLQSSNIFQTDKVEDVKKKAKKIKITNEKCTTAEKKSSLPVKLINTVVLQDKVKSIASVQVRSGSGQEHFRIGDKIPGMAKIDMIRRMEVIIKNLRTGVCEKLVGDEGDTTPSVINVLSASDSKKFIKKKKKIKGIKNDGNKFEISKSYINKQLENLSSLLTQARGIPIHNPDGTMSFKVVEISPGSIFSTLGIENEDVITQINGQPINDLNEVMSLFGRLKNLDKLQLTINRGGLIEDKDYKIK